MVGVRRIVTVVGPMCGLAGLVHFLDHRPGRGVLVMTAGLLLLFDLGQTVHHAATVGADTVAAGAAALDTWLYLLLALWDARRSWHAPGAATAAEWTNPSAAVPKQQ